MLREDTIKLIWYQFEATLTRLGLIGRGLSITPATLNMYMTKYLPAVLPWDYGSSEISEEEPEQMAALHELAGMELLGDLFTTLSRLFNEK